MKRVLLVAVAVLLTGALCFASGGKEAAGAKSGAPVTLKVGMSQTTMTAELFQAMITMFEKANPNIKVSLEITSADTIVPKIVSGDMPDVVSEGVANFNELVNEKKILSLNALFASKAYDSTQTVEQTLVTGAADCFRVGDQSYQLPLQPGFMSLVVNKKMFRENGWKIPGTFQELLDVSKKIRAKGIKPIGYTALGWMNRNESIMFAPAVYEYGGNKALVDLDNLVPGAWKSDIVVKANQVMKTLVDQGVIDKEGLGMDGPQCQLEFVLEKSAMCTSGFWFEQEMKDQMPADAEYTVIPFPTTGLGKNTKQSLLSWYNSCFAWGATKQVEATYAFMRYLVSYEFQSYWGKVGKLTLLSNRKALEELQTMPESSSFTKEVQRLVANPNVELIQSKYQFWYKDQMRVPVQNELNAIVIGQVTHEQAAANMEGYAAALRNDSSIEKLKR